MSNIPEFDSEPLWDYLNSLPPCPVCGAGIGMHKMSFPCAFGNEAMQQKSDAPKA